MSRRWKQERERLGLASDVTLHVFRHDFISRLANDGHTPLPVLPAAAEILSRYTDEVLAAEGEVHA